MEPHVMVMAGGTGGHLFPALAVAEWLRREGCRIQLDAAVQGKHRKHN